MYCHETAANVKCAQSILYYSLTYVPMYGSQIIQWNNVDKSVHAFNDSDNFVT
jgi:hypothetical protein